jgi:hypothetical protein
MKMQRADGDGDGDGRDQALMVELQQLFRLYMMGVCQQHDAESPDSEHTLCHKAEMRRTSGSLRQRAHDSGQQSDDEGQSAYHPRRRAGRDGQCGALLDCCSDEDADGVPGVSQSQRGNKAEDACVRHVSVNEGESGSGHQERGRRALRNAANNLEGRGGLELPSDEEDADLIEDGKIDLGQYAVEQLALSLDPFPRKPGAEFVQPEEPAEISPFAALKALKPQDGQG